MFNITTIEFLLMSVRMAAYAAAADVQHRPQRITNQIRPSGPPARPPVVVDREKTCPLLLRVFTQQGSHHVPEDFAVRGKEPKGEVQIYTWKDATLKELSNLIKEVIPLARRRDARLSFAFVYPNRHGTNVIRNVGMIFSNGRRSTDENKSLEELNFQTGDFLDVAIYV